jgi:hypothetical protein
MKDTEPATVSKFIPFLKTIIFLQIPGKNGDWIPTKKHQKSVSYFIHQHKQKDNDPEDRKTLSFITHGGVR